MHYTVEVAVRMGDRARAESLAGTLVTELLKKRKNEDVFRLYTTIKQVNPEFVFPVKEQLALGEWLASTNKGMEAAKVYRELGVKYADHSTAPLALFRCAELLYKRLGKLDNARSIYDYLIKTYPDSPMAVQANAAIDSMLEP